MPTEGLGVLWLHPADYPRFREICGPSVDDTYEAWRNQVERKLKALTRQGVEVERVLINPDEFAEWCKENGYELDGEGRAVYPAYLLAIRQSPGPLDRG
jgi:hypothetical protein